MDWDRRPELKTWVLDDVFDRSRGWYITEDEASVRRSLADDGNPTYSVTIGRIGIWAYEQRHWAVGHEKNVSAGRICAHVDYTGITIHDPRSLLRDTCEARGFPAFGLNVAGQPTLHTAFPIAPGFPVDLARRQLMVCMGLLALEAERYLAAWNANSPQSKTGRNVDWNLIGNVSSVAGKFLRGFAGF